MKHLRLIATLFMFVMMSAPTIAQTYPSRTLRLITPYPAGSGTDTLLRSIGGEFAKSWSQPVVIDNRPGGATIIAHDACAKAAPDGYTLCMVDRGGLSMLPHLYRKLPYDAAKDFEPVTLMAYLISAITINPDLKANSMAELIALARANPGKLNYGSMGDGTPPHLVIEWINQKYGIKLVHVPYKSPPALVQSILASEVQLTYFGLINMLGPIRGGKARALAVSGERRTPLLPDVPTLAEAGLTGLDDRVWFGLAGPAGMPRDIVDRLHREVVRIFTTPEFREQRLVSQGWEPVANTPAEFARLIRADREVAADLVKISGAVVQ